MSNRKRRLCAPQKLTEEKRKRLSWDLVDATRNVEFVNANSCLSGELRGHFEGDGRIIDKETETSSYGRARKPRQYSEKEEAIQCKLSGRFPVDFWHCVLGTFEMSFNNVRCLNVAVTNAVNLHDSEAAVEMLLDVTEEGCEHFKVAVVLPISFVSSIHFFQALQSDPAKGCDHAGDFSPSSFVAREKLEVLDYLQKKGMISLVVKQTNITQGEHIQVAVCLHESGLTLLSHSSLNTFLRKSDRLLKELMLWFFPDTRPHILKDMRCPNIEQKAGFESLYAAVKTIRDNDACPTAVKSPGLDNQSLKFLPGVNTKEVKGLASGSCLDEESHCGPQDLTKLCSGETCESHELNYLQHLDLLPTLRGYQRRAVQWMLERELCQSTKKGLSCEPHPLWRECNTKDGKTIYFNPYTGRLTREQFSTPPLPCGGILADEMGLGKTVEVLALILNNPRKLETSSPESLESSAQKAKQLTPADTSQEEIAEVGGHHSKSLEKDGNGMDTEQSHLSSQVGSDSGAAAVSSDDKTGSVMAKCQCVCGKTDPNTTACLLQCEECKALLHAECLGHVSETGSLFFCPNCAVSRSLVPSGATLIISPASISQQWVEEVTRHTRPSALKLLVYEGVAKQGFIQPEMLASHDIILTTYSTLRADFYHVHHHAGKGRSMRFQKRYTAIPSPLTAVNFWRICLDEAQIVETTTAKAAEMALKLHCNYRWCVTGTPIQKGLEDIFGLLLFLGVSPYDQRAWWKELLYDPYVNGNTRPMHEVLAKIMWRSAKKDVIHEINLPEQSQKVHWLTFTPVEQHFYRRQHEECCVTAKMMLGKWQDSGIKLSSLDRHTVHWMLNPLLRLRQACCHPQVVRGGFLSMQKRCVAHNRWTRRV